jgi:hypothetical protein
MNEYLKNTVQIRMMVWNGIMIEKKCKAIITRNRIFHHFIIFLLAQLRDNLRKKNCGNSQ